jgi:creatinine amidohydrolase/Fe(II)-dependent formamide hydrolase-like protein
LIKAEAKAANARHAETHFIATSETDLVSPDLFIVNHAALGEIALLMATDPDCVKLDRLPQEREPTLEQDAVWGPDPREASAELGQKFIAGFVAGAREAIHKIYPLDP